ncbi:MAG: dienelactone hydrolase [Acidimicrobiia bacterium]|nr:dienelactone hydrolase [Acidimicrobiia bacterium]
MSVYRGPRKGADRAVLLAHGAGSDHRAPVLVAVADALAEAGVPSLRFDYPYRVAGRRAPDRPPVLASATRDAAAELARRSGLPPERLVLGGRSMGGRYCSQLVGDETDPLPALGLLLLGYPLHPAGRPERRRAEHFSRLRVPVCFVSGTRDALARRDDLVEAAAAIPGPVTWCWLETADHGFRPLRSSGRTAQDLVEDVAAASVAWVTTLPG